VAELGVYRKENYITLNRSVKVFEKKNNKVYLKSEILRIEVFGSFEVKLEMFGIVPPGEGECADMST
jgi:hypothetical protein